MSGNLWSCELACPNSCRFSGRKPFPFTLVARREARHLAGLAASAACVAMAQEPSQAALLPSTQAGDGD